MEIMQNSFTNKQRRNLHFEEKKVWENKFEIV